MYTEYSHLTMDKLMELLTLRTVKLTHLLLEKNVFSHDYEVCKDEIHKLTEEIGERKKLGAFTMEASTTYYPYVQQSAIKH